VVDEAHDLGRQLRLDVVKGQTAIATARLYQSLRPSSATSCSVRLVDAYRDDHVRLTGTGAEITNSSIVITLTYCGRPARAGRFSPLG
jgi:hypothetical protein